MVLEHPLGTVFGQGQTIRHTFLLKNSTTAPLRIHHASAESPCCSSIESLPDEIAPSAQGEVTVVFRPGYSAGPRHVAFKLDTDNPSLPGFHLGLTADVVPCFESSPLSEPKQSAAWKSFRIVCRRLADGSVGLSLPERVEVKGPFTASLGEKQAGVPNPAGLIEDSAVLSVQLADDLAIGSHRGSIRLAWPDGSTRHIPLSHTVPPPISASPPAFFLTGADASGATRTVLLDTDQAPFRVMEVQGPIRLESPSLPAASAASHTIRFALDPDRLDPGKASSVRIITDHPHQPTIELTLLHLAQPGGTAR
jgi:hypothetical protein